jgi:hypothetical protein
VIAEAVRTVQGLCIYDVVAQDFYGVKLPAKRQEEIHLRTPEAMLERIRELDPRPLEEPRPPQKRLAARCGNFTLLLVTMLREKGVRARARCGFGAYFNPPQFEDHWVCEYWKADASRWALADAQFDDVWQKTLKIRHDVLDVPREQFLVAADAWRRCRAGEADPDKFGIAFAHLRGLWFVAGSLVRDIAALNGAPALPWDVWGAMPRAARELSAKELAYFDRLAQASEEELKTRYESDPGLRMPPRVFNALRNAEEAIAI